MVERLILVEAGEDNRFLARLWIFMHLEALGADLLHHALHRRVDAADGVMVRVQIGAEEAVPGLLDAPHHPVGADHDQAIGLVEVMKSFHQIPAGATGTVVEFLVGDEDEVDAGQPVAVVETA